MFFLPYQHVAMTKKKQKKNNFRWFLLRTMNKLPAGFSSTHWEWVSTVSHRTTSRSAGHLSATYADWIHNLALHLVHGKKRKRWASKTTSNRLIVEGHMTQQLRSVLLCLFVCPVVLMSSAFANTSVGTKEVERRKQGMKDNPASAASWCWSQR